MKWNRAQKLIHTYRVNWYLTWISKGNTMEKKSFQKIVLKPLDNHMQKQKWLTDLTPLTKIPSKWITDKTLNCCCCSVAQSCLTLCNPMNHAACQASLSFSISWSFAQTHVLWDSDAIPPSHPLLSPSPPAFNLSQHQGLFQWVSSSY